MSEVKEYSQKIYQCSGCPLEGLNGIGQPACRHVDHPKDRTLRNYPVIPDWCPLPDAKETEQFCDVLRELRKAKRWSCQEFCDRIGLYNDDASEDIVTYAKWEEGESTPDADIFSQGLRGS